MVDSYLDLCKSRGEEPNRPYSGQIPLRIKPDLHREVVTRATAAGLSVNRWVAQQLEEAVTAE